MSIRRRRSFSAGVKVRVGFTFRGGVDVLVLFVAWWGDFGTRLVVVFVAVFVVVDGFVAAAGRGGRCGSAYANRAAGVRAPPREGVAGRRRGVDADADADAGRFMVGRGGETRGVVVVVVVGWRRGGAGVLHPWSSGRDDLGAGGGDDISLGRGLEYFCLLNSISLYINQGRNMRNGG